MLNLHVHSTASDGAVPPGDLPRMASEAGLSALALTDHDTTAGLEAFCKAGETFSNLRCVPGIEIACEFPEGEEIHVVGLFIDGKNEPLNQALEQVRIWRQERNLRILERLEAIGKPVTLDEVRACFLASDTVLGRPHIARAMVCKGYVKDIREAFHLYLQQGKPGYAARMKLSAVEGIRLLHGAGGVAVWAHPLTRSLTATKFRALAGELAKLNLDGLEVWYPEHDEKKTATALAVAREFGLSLSGGTDFHGAGAHQGIGLASVNDRPFRIPDSILPLLEKRAERWRQA